MLRQSAADESNESLFYTQWRLTQQIEFYSAAPQGLLAGLTWTWLALTTPKNTPVRWLYAVAAVIVPSVVPFSILVQRRTMAKISSQSQDQRDTRQPERLLKSWARHQYVRTGLITTGTVLGGLAAFNETFLGGIQVGASVVVGGLVRSQTSQQG